MKKIVRTTMTRWNERYVTIESKTESGIMTYTLRQIKNLNSNGEWEWMFA